MINPSRISTGKTCCLLAALPLNFSIRRRERYSLVPHSTFIYFKNNLFPCTPLTLSPSFFQHFQFHSVKFQFHLILASTKFNYRHLRWNDVSRNEGKGRKLHWSRFVRCVNGKASEKSSTGKGFDVAVSTTCDPETCSIRERKRRMRLDEKEKGSTLIGVRPKKRFTNTSDSG